MNSRWVGERVPVVDLQRILEDICLRRDDVSWGARTRSFSFQRKAGRVQSGAPWKAAAGEECSEPRRIGNRCEGTHSVSLRRERRSL